MAGTGDPPREAGRSLRAVQAMLGLSRHTIEQLVRMGYVTPGRGPRNALSFSFRDIVLLRAAHELRRASIPARRILRALARLRAELPDRAPLQGLRITAVGDTVAVRSADAQWEADTGQLLMDLSVGADAGPVAELPRKAPASPEPVEDAQTLFVLGETLEPEDPDAAERAWRDAIALQPDFRDAYLNLGALLCEQGRAAQAVTLYAQALRHCEADALLHYNRAVALEDCGRLQEAVAAYEEALRLDPTCADAHHNVAGLHDRLGDARAALRHFSAWRRLQRAAR